MSRYPGSLQPIVETFEQKIMLNEMDMALITTVTMDTFTKALI